MGKESTPKNKIESPEELSEKSLRHRLAELHHIADQYQSASLMLTKEEIEELIKEGELEKADKILTEVEPEAKEWKETVSEERMNAWRKKMGFDKEK